MRPWLRHFVVAVVLGLAGVVLSLGLIGTATAQGGGQGSPFNPLSALIVNTESAPVPVSLTGSVEIASPVIPFQEEGVSGADNGAFTVPADKRAVIKFITGVCSYPATLTRNGIIVVLNNTLIRIASNTPSKLSEVTTNAFISQVFFTHEVLMTAEPGSKFYFDTFPGASCLGMIAGDLVPAD